MRCSMFVTARHSRQDRCRKAARSTRQYFLSGGLRIMLPALLGGASLILPDGTQTVTVIKPDVVAPGVQVWSCVPPGPGAGAGTSP